MTEGELIGSGADVDRANAARMYDYFLGGAHNFAVDRELADRAAAAFPAREWARGNRAFLMSAVRYCAERGIDQFLDLGSGIPTVDHVHTTARAVIPDARVAYVDVEPVAVAHSRAILADVDGVTITHADVRHPDTVLGAAAVRDTIDFSRPVALLAVAIIHFIGDESDPVAILDRYRSAPAPGSYLALAHASLDYDEPEFVARLDQATTVYRSSATPGHPRDRSRIHELLGDHPLVEPGLVDIARWRTDRPDATPLGSYAALSSLP